METIANSSEDVLIDALSYKLGNSASYITDRKSVTFHPSGSNIYTPGSGTKVIKFQLNSEGWLDTSTVVVNFDVHNKESTATQSKKLRTLQGPHSFFRRLRISAGGSLIEDIDMYIRTHQMFEMLTTSSNRDNNDIEGFGYRSDTLAPDHVHGATSLPGVKQGSHQTVGFKLCSGLLNQSKMLPLNIWET